MINNPFTGDNNKIISNKNKNKFFEEKYLIKSPYYTFNDKRIAVFSDIHYQAHVSKDIYLLIYYYVLKCKPDYVVFPGDIFENDSIIDNKEELDFFTDLISLIAEICPVIIIPGNHDIQNLNIHTYFFNNSEKTTKIIKYLESLNKIKNVYFLNNEQTLIDGINFVGFCPSYPTYSLGIKRSAVDRFMDEYVKSGLSMDENKFNILLTHNSIPFTISDKYKEIEDFNKKTDLIIAGHLHGGYLPKFIYKKVRNTKFGLFVYPPVLPIPGLDCRGLHDIGRGKLFISKCFRKWTCDIPLFNYFETFTANDVEELTLTKGEEMTLTRRQS